MPDLQNRYSTTLLFPQKISIEVGSGFSCTDSSSIRSSFYFVADFFVASKTAVHCNREKSVKTSVSIDGLTGSIVNLVFVSFRTAISYAIEASKRSNALGVEATMSSRICCGGVMLLSYALASFDASSLSMSHLYCSVYSRCVRSTARNISHVFVDLYSANNKD